MQKLSLLYSNGAPPEHPHPGLVQDVTRLDEFKTEIVTLIEINSRVSGLCKHPQAIFELEFIPNVDLSVIDSRTYIPMQHREAFEKQLTDWRTKDFIRPLPKVGLVSKWVLHLCPNLTKFVSVLTPFISTVLQSSHHPNSNPSSKSTTVSRPRKSFT
jgi:hypothetical protein